MPAPQRVSYHTQLKCLAREGLLDKSIALQIPRSNIHRWKSEHPDKYRSFDLNLASQKDYELIKAFSQHRQAKKVFTAYVRLVKLLLSIVHAFQYFHRCVKENSRAVVKAIERVKEFIGLKRSLRFFNISIPTFQNWKAQSNTVCFKSLTNSCVRIFHNQLTKPEVMKLKELLTDQRFQYWPTSSIALHALRENILPLSLNTWYKYTNQLGMKRSRTADRRKKSVKGIRAERPHAIWHADITIFTTADNIKHYLYLVADNYSRKILSWRIADVVKRDIRKATIEEAVKELKPSSTPITLITDGGPENTFTDLLSSFDQPIEHKIALTDIHFSNSLIEAHNKTIKYNYLYRMNIANGEELTKIFPTIVNDFNNRPHVSLHGLTPNEACEGLSIDSGKLKLHKQRATEQRKLYNRDNRCPQCID